MSGWAESGVERGRGARSFALGRRVDQFLGSDRLEVIAEISPAGDDDVEAQGFGLLGELSGGRVGLELAGLRTGEGGAGEEAHHPGRVGLGQCNPRDAATAQPAGDPARIAQQFAVGRGAFGGDDGGPLRRCSRRGLEQKDHSVCTAA